MHLFQIRTADLSWRDAKKVLRKDQRWDLVKSLEIKEELFTAHVINLNKKKKASSSANKKKNASSGSKKKQEDDEFPSLVEAGEDVEKVEL